MRDRKRTTLGKCKVCSRFTCPAFSTSRECPQCEADRIIQECYDKSRKK